MATVQTSAPAVEPITLADVKAHLRIDTGDEDALLQSLILTSRLHIEVALGLALIQQTWSCFFDRWPALQDARGAPLQPAGVVFTVADPRARLDAASDAVMLPIHPIQSVDAIRVYAEDGTFAALPLDGFSIDRASNPARVVRQFSTATPTPGRRVNGIELSVTAGFGPNPSDVPASIRLALLMLVAHWYEHRDPGEIGSAAAKVPQLISALLSPYLPVRL